MAQSKKMTPKKGARAGKKGFNVLPAGQSSPFVLAATWTFTILSVVFAAFAYWSYA